MPSWSPFAWWIGTARHPQRVLAFRSVADSVNERGGQVSTWYPLRLLRTLQPRALEMPRRMVFGMASASTLRTSIQVPSAISFQSSFLKPCRKWHFARKFGHVAVAADGRSLITSIGMHQSAVWIHDALGDRPLSSQGHVPHPESTGLSGTIPVLLAGRQIALLLEE
jgi:hypothetical protein